MKHELKTKLTTAQLVMQTVQDYTDAVLRFHALYICNDEEQKWIRRRLKEIVERVNVAIERGIKEMYFVRDFFLDRFYDAELSPVVREIKDDCFQHFDDDVYGVNPFEETDEDETYSIVEYERFAFEIINKLKRRNACFLSLPESIALLCQRIEAHYYEQRSISESDRNVQIGDSVGLNELATLLLPYMQANHSVAVLCYAQIAFDTVRCASSFFEEKESCFSREMATEKLLENQLVDQLLYKRVCCCAQNASWQNTLNILQFVQKWENQKRGEVAYE